MAADDALAVWDAVVEAGEPHGLTLFGQTALLMARIEAGLLLLDVDFEPSRFAENDEHRSTPLELGLGWMLTGIEDDSDRSSAATQSSENGRGNLALEDDGADRRLGGVRRSASPKPT